MSQDFEPHVNLNHDHDEAMAQQNLIPDTLYRLRLSVLKDHEGHINCPSQMFTFKSFKALQEASSSITNAFGSGFSVYDIKRVGVLEEGTRGTEDGRTEDLTLEYDSEIADETWEEFLKRAKGVGKGWQTELWTDKEKTWGRQVVRGVEVPEYS